MSLESFEESGESDQGDDTNLYPQYSVNREEPDEIIKSIPATKSQPKLKGVNIINNI